MLVPHEGSAARIERRPLRRVGMLGKQPLPAMHRDEARCSAGKLFLVARDS
jgi:hypothetical protein